MLYILNLCITFIFALHDENKNIFSLPADLREPEKVGTVSAHYSELFFGKDKVHVEL